MNDRLDHRFTTPQVDDIGALLRRPAGGSGPGLILA